MRQNKKFIDLLLLLAYPVIGYFISFTLNINAFFSSFVFFGVPALHLCLRRPRAIKRSLIFSLFALPMMIVIDYISQITKIWAWPLPNSIFPFKLLGHVSIEILVWAYLNFFVVVMFYEYFFETNHIKKLWYPITRQFVYLQAVFCGIFIILMIAWPNLLHIPYWYLVFGLLFLLPPIILEEIRFPHVFLKLLKASVYFMYLTFIYEIAALKIGWWQFPSKQFIGVLPILGLRIPFEEFLFWIILLGLTILSFYEYFDNNER